MLQTPEERKVTQIVNDAKEQERAVDEAAHPQGPAPQPAPPGGGMFMGPQIGRGMQDDFARQQQKEVIRQDALNQSAEAIKGSLVDTQAKAYRVVDDYAYPDTARQNEPHLKKAQEKGIDDTQRSALHQMGHTDMKARHEKGKDVSESQDYAMRVLGDEKEKKGLQSGKEQRPFEGASMSQRFSQSLGYSKLNKPLEKETPISDNKQVMSMSQRFASSLHYNNKESEKKEPALTKEMKTNGRDMTKE